MKALKEKTPTFRSNPYLVTFFSVSFCTFILGLVLFAFTYLSSGTTIVKAEEIKWTPPSGKSIMEVHIANNGMVYLQGARVESVSGATIVASTSWNLTKLTWTIYTNGSDYGERHFGTSFLDSKGNKLKINDIHEGNVITVSGLFDMSQTGLNIKADNIRTSH